MRRVGLAVLAAVLMAAGCTGAGRGGVRAQPDCGHPVVSQNAPVFFVTLAGETGACGYTYRGKPAGRLLKSTPCIEACAVPRPSLDGHFTLSGFAVSDTASGRVVARMPDDVLDLIWAPDGRHLCGVQGGPALPVVLVIAGLDGRLRKVTLAKLFTGGFSNIDVITCDPQHSRAVLQASYQQASSVAMVSLTNGAMLAEHHFPDAVTQVIPSANARYIAVQHVIQSASGAPAPTYVDVFDVDHPSRLITRLRGVQATAFSGDGTLLAVQVPHMTRVVRWSDGNVIWQGTGTPAAEASAPGVPVIAIETYRPGRPADQIVLVRPDGRLIRLADGQLTRS